MRATRLALLLTTLVVLGPMLSACADGFDMDKLDVFGLNEKKKLPGERRALFPEGVPGVTQGVPPELIKGNQPPPEETAAAAPVAPVAAPEKPKPKPRVAKRAPTRVTVSPDGGQARQPQAADSPWPSTAPAQPAPQQAPQTQWPAPPASGTFSR
jgi:hypothetical protein